MFWSLHEVVGDKRGKEGKKKRVWICVWRRKKREKEKKRRNRMNKKKNRGKKRIKKLKLRNAITIFSQ